MQLQGHLVFRFPSSNAYIVSLRDLAAACSQRNNCGKILEVAKRALQGISSNFCEIFLSQERSMTCRNHLEGDGLQSKVTNAIKLFCHAMALMEASSQMPFQDLNIEQSLQVLQAHDAIVDAVSVSDEEKALLFLTTASLEKNEQREFVAMYQDICEKGGLFFEEKIIFCRKFCAFEVTHRSSLMNSLYSLLCASKCFEDAVSILSAVSHLRAKEACYYLDSIELFFDPEKWDESQLDQMSKNVEFILKKVAEFPFQDGKAIIKLFFEFFHLNLSMWSSPSVFCVEALTVCSLDEDFKDLLLLFLIYSRKQGFISPKLKEILLCLSSLTFQERQILKALEHPLVDIRLSPHDKQEHYFSCLVLFAKVADDSRKEVLDFLNEVYSVSLYTELREVSSIVAAVEAIAKEDSAFLREEELHTLLSLVPGNCRQDVLRLLVSFESKMDFLHELKPLLDCSLTARTFVSFDQVEQLFLCFQEGRQQFASLFQQALEISSEEYAQEDPYTFLNVFLFTRSLPESMQKLINKEEARQILFCHSPKSRLKVLEGLRKCFNVEQSMRFLACLLQGIEEGSLKEAEALSCLDKYPEESWPEIREALFFVIGFESAQKLVRGECEEGEEQTAPFSFSTRLALLELFMQKEQAVREFFMKDEVHSFLASLSEEKLIKLIGFLLANKKRELWIKHLRLFLSSLHVEERSNIPIERLFSIPEEECFALMNHLIPFCGRVDSLEVRIDILFCLRTVSPHQRVEVLEALYPIFQAFPEGMGEEVRLKRLFVLAEQQSRYILPYLSSHVLQKKAAPFKEVFDCIESYPKYCMEKFCRFLKKKGHFFPDTWIYSYLLANSLYIAPKDYQSFVEGSTLYLSEKVTGSNSRHRAHFLFGSPGALERSKRYIQYLLEKLEEEDWTLTAVAELVEHCKAVPQGIPLELLKLLLLFKDREEQEFYPLLRQLLCAKGNTRTNLAQITEAMLDSYLFTFPYEYVLHLLRVAPEQTRTAFLYEVLKNKTFFVRLSSVSSDFLFQSFFVAPEGLSRFFLFVESSLARTNFPEDTRQVLAEFFQCNPDLVELSHAFLAASLAEAEEKCWHERKFWVEQICMGVIDFLTEYMQVYEEHELYQISLRLKINLSSEKENKVKSPYKIHAQHQIWQNQEVTFNLPEEKIEEAWVCLDVESMGAKVRERSFSFADLPQHIGWNTLIGFFDEIDVRIEGMDEQTRSFFHSEVISQTTETYVSLKDNLIRDESLKRLLLIKGSEKERPPEALIGFLGILRYIAELPAEPSPGKVLSPREEVLFSASASIQKCVTGKREGIALFYNRLEDNYKFCKQQLNELPSIERAKTLVYNLVQAAILSALSDENPLTCALTLGNGAASFGIEQISHQAGYLKNMIGKRVGLSHSLSFDPHTHCLYDHLLTFSLREVLDLFYEYFTPSFLIDAVQKGVEREKSANTTTYNNICNLLELCGESFLEVWDEEQNFAFTRKGAILLLLKEGYLRNSLSSDAF